MSYATTHIHQYSVEFYKQLEAETGLNAGFSVVGNLRMAQTQERMDEYMVYATTAETCGVPYEWLSPAQIKERYPLSGPKIWWARFIIRPTAISIRPMSLWRWPKARASAA